MQRPRDLPHSLFARCSPRAVGANSGILSIASNDSASPRTAYLACAGVEPVELILEDGFE